MDLFVPVSAEPALFVIDMQNHLLWIAVIVIASGQRSRAELTALTESNANEMYLCVQDGVLIVILNSDIVFSGLRLVDEYHYQLIF